MLLNFHVDPQDREQVSMLACGAKNTEIDHPVMALMDPRPGQCIKP